MKKVLLVATVQSHICQFHKPLVKLLHENGVEVHVAAHDNLAVKNGLKLDFVEKVFDLPFERSPFSPKNLKAKKQLKKIIDENEYDVVHCNTPVGGIMTRLAAKDARKKGTKVFYTAHGFHFYKGASKKNWLIYYPIEKYFATKTDKLITITTEDYALASEKFKTNVCYMHGVGANNEKYKVLTAEEKSALRKAQGYSDDDIIFLCTGELNANKNQSTAIDAFEMVHNKYPNTKLLLAGNGPTDEMLKAKINEKGLEGKVIMLGYRTDLEIFTGLCDIVVSASFREGMPLNIMEGMICEKPIVASNNRGHRELIAVGETGYIVDAHDANAFADKMEEFAKDETKRIEFGKRGSERIRPWCMDSIVEELREIYELK